MRRPTDLAGPPSRLRAAGEQEVGGAAGRRGQRARNHPCLRPSPTRPGPAGDQTAPPSSSTLGATRCSPAPKRGRSRPARPAAPTATNGTECATCLFGRLADGLTRPRCRHCQGMAGGMAGGCRHRRGVRRATPTPTALGAELETRRLQEGFLLALSPERGQHDRGDEEGSDRSLRTCPLN